MQYNSQNDGIIRRLLTRISILYDFPCKTINKNFEFIFMIDGHPEP